MTSELKPIDIWEDATNAVCQIMQESKMCNCPDGECLASTVEPSKETMAQWNTRAAPDVPELVRYGEDWSEDTGKLMMVKLSEGEYVRHDQAAAVIAAKDGRITDYKNLVDALHAKLAQYEAQKPVGYVSEYGLNKLASRAFHQMVDVRKSIEGDHTIPLYAQPAPAADLKAENDGLREALEFYADTSKYPAPLTGGMGDLWSDCGQIARAALNVETSNDKA